MRQGRLCNGSHKPDLRRGVRCGIPVRERCGGRGRHGSTRWFLIIPEVASRGFDGGDGILTRNPSSKIDLRGGVVGELSPKQVKVFAKNAKAT